MANNQNKNDKNQNEILTVSKENYEKLLKQISELTNKNLKENKKLNEKEQKYLLDMQMRSLNKLKEERLKAITLEIEQIERIKKETLKKLNEEYFALERNIKISSDKIKIEKDERDKAFNEFESIKNKAEKLIQSGRIKEAKVLDEELKQKEKYYKEIETSLYSQQNGMKESLKLLEEKNVAIAELEGIEIENSNNRILTLKKEKEEIQKIRKEHSEEYEEKSRQQRLINDLYYESIRKQKESLGWKNRVIDEFTGVFSMFGEGTKILGTSSKFLLDVMTKPSKKKIEEKVQTDFGGLSTHTSPSPTPEIQQPEPELEKKSNVEKPTPNIEKKQPVEKSKPEPTVEKKQPVEQPVKQSTVEKQTFKEKTTNNNNTEKSEIALKREERFQKTHEAFVKIKDNPIVRKKEEYNARRRKSTKSDIQNKSDDTLGDIAPIEKAEDKKEEKNRFEKLNKSVDGVRDSVEKTQGFAMLQMLQMIGIMGGLAITMGLWYDLWKQKKELDDVIKSNEEEREFRNKQADTMEDPIIKDIEARIEKTTDEDDKKSLENALSEYKESKKERRALDPISGLDSDDQMLVSMYGSSTFEKMKESADKKEGTSWSKMLTLNTSLREKEEKQKSEIEKKQKEEIKNQRSDSESFYKVTEEDRGITESQRVTTELETAKMKTQKEAGTPSVTVNVPTNDESTSLLGDILDVLSNRQPTTELK